MEFLENHISKTNLGPGLLLFWVMKNHSRSVYNHVIRSGEKIRRKKKKTKIKEIQKRTRNYNENYQQKRLLGFQGLFFAFS